MTKLKIYLFTSQPLPSQGLLHFLAALLGKRRASNDEDPPPGLVAWSLGGGTLLAAGLDLVRKEQLPRGPIAPCPLPTPSTSSLSQGVGDRLGPKQHNKPITKIIQTICRPTSNYSMLLHLSTNVKVEVEVRPKIESHENKGTTNIKINAGETPPGI